MVATAAINAKASHALRQLSPASRATGAARATPHPVPELIADRTRARRRAAKRSETTSEKGGNTRPALAPAIRRPAKRAPVVSAAPAITLPVPAQAPPAATTIRGPSRTDRAPAVTEVIRYAM
jgi:hypothetical protein